MVPHPRGYAGPGHVAIRDITGERNLAEMHRVELERLAAETFGPESVKTLLILTARPHNP